MSNLRWEAWPYPGTTPYTVKVRDLQAVDGSGSKPKSPVGNGSVTIPKGVTEVDGSVVLDNVVYADPADPSNDVTSLIRVYRPGTDDPIHEWLVEDPVTESDDGDTVRLSGRNIEAVLDHEYVEVWDWDGSTTFQSTFPDHIYGGRNLIKNGSLEESDTIAESYQLYNDQTPGGTFTLTMEGNTTAALAFNATATQVETAIEATAGITDCLVTGSGTAADPWIIEFVDPGIIDPDMTVNDLTGLTSTLTQTQDGELSIAPFTISQTLALGVNHPHGVHASDSPSISTTFARTGTYSLRFNGLTAPFTGVQQVVNVKPGGVYQASMWALTTDTAAPWRLVIRTLTEDYIASSTPFSGTTLAASTWTQFSTSVTIPDGVTQVVMRFAYVGTGNPGPVYTDDWEFKEGQAADNIGNILTDLFDDAQTDHAPTRAALTFINLDFDGITDSAANLWDSNDISITIKRGQSYLQMMRQIEKLGYEWRLTPTSGTPGEWDLQVFIPGGMGTDYGGADDPAIVIGQGTLPSNITRQAPVANYLMAEGKDGLTSRTSSASSIAAVGRRAQAVTDRRFTDSTDLATWVAQRLNDFLAETLAPRATITEPGLDASSNPIWPRPLADYDTADIVDFILADGSTRVERRIESVTYQDNNGLVWTVEGGTSAPFIQAPTGQPNVAGYASQLRVLGDAVSTILSEFRFQEDLADAQATPSTGLGAGIKPAFTVRVAAVAARTESKAAADLLCTGGNDGATINTAIDICDALGFGRVLLSEGLFVIATGTTFTINDGVALYGLGEDVTTLRLPDGGNATITGAGDFGRFTLSEEGGT